MDSQSFVAAIREYVKDAAIVDTISNVENPPGRRVSDDMRALSSWYHSLDNTQKKHVEAIAQMTAHAATFGMLAVLDGARTITSDGGEFELQYHGTETVRLNSPSVDLHSLL